MKPKVLVFSEIFPPKNGGSGRWFFELYSRISAISPTFLVGKAHGDEEFDIKHAHLAIQRYTPKPSSWGFKSWPSIKEYWRQYRLLKAQLKKFEATEIHCCRILPEGVPALLTKLRYGIPYHCFIHGEDIEVARTSRELTLLTKLVMRFASKLICNSETTKGYIEKYWSAFQDKAVVLHPGVDTDYFTPLLQSTSQPKLNTEPLCLLTVGRLQQRKGHDVVIKALAELKRHGIIYHYRIAGDGDQKPVLKALVQQHQLNEQVFFLDEITDEILKKEYQQCDIFILANRRVGNDDEGFGMVLLEAQACGKPVIAGKSGGTWETMQHNVSGWLLDCTTEFELVSLLANKSELLKTLPSFALAGQAYVNKNYGWQTLTIKAKKIFGWY